MKQIKNILALIPRLAVFLLLTITGCASIDTGPPPFITPATAYIPSRDSSLSARFAPVFLIDDNHHPHNRIGSPIAWQDQQGKIHISINPDQPAIYSQQFSFQTDKAAYKNLVYRIHFQETPFGLCPFYLTSGKNVGLIVIVTLNKQEQPVLITSVHACGCYLAFTPTSLLPASSLPSDWNKKTQNIYGVSLPGLLQLDPVNGKQYPAITLAIRADTHRVTDISRTDEELLPGLYPTVSTPLLPMQALHELTVDSGTTSFFETVGPRKGYVKESFKPRERLLMSWWTFDWRIGEDKAYEPGVPDGITFYTSIKFWARNQSDMRNFPQFLQYWGWNL